MWINMGESPLKLKYVIRAAEKVKAERAVKEKTHNQLHEDITQ